MPEVIKTYQQKIPAMRLIGKKHDSPSHWSEWFQNGWFSAIETAAGGEEAAHALYEDADAYCALYRKMGEQWEYWIGEFVSPKTVPPDGFEALDFPEGTLGVCWVKGKEGELYASEDLYLSAVLSAGYILHPEYGQWTMERYACPRFTTPDAEGNVILDIGWFLQ